MPERNLDYKMISRFYLKHNNLQKFLFWFRMKFEKILYYEVLVEIIL